MFEKVGQWILLWRLLIRDVEVAISSTSSLSTPIASASTASASTASASTNKKRENDRWP